MHLLITVILFDMKRHTYILLTVLVHCKFESVSLQYRVN